MKKAYLVFFVITTRVVTEEKGDPNGNMLVEADEKAFDDIVSKACDNLYEQAPDFGENVTEIIEDVECPYGTYPGEEL